MMMMSSKIPSRRLCAGAITAHTLRLYPRTGKRVWQCPL